MDFDEREDRDGVRLTWNNVPRSRLQHQRNVVPLAALYTPLNTKRSVPYLGASRMLRCRQCKAFANAYAFTQAGVWLCQFCGFSNRAEPHDMVHANLTTVEYDTGRAAALPPVFVYVVDTCFDADDPAFSALQDAVAVLLQMLPPNALVALVSFSQHVLVHDLTAPNRSYAFHGGKEYTAADVQRMLGLEKTGYGSVARRFLRPAGAAEYDIAAAIERLAPDEHAAAHERPNRATGCALNVAALALQAMVGASAGGHVMCFVGGVATYGPGRVVGLPLREPIRSHHDIERAAAAPVVGMAAVLVGTHVAQVDTLLGRHAREFYGRVAAILVSIGVGCDVFVGCYDQVGVHEMEVVAARTGGAMVMCDLFATSMFRHSLVRFMRKNDSTNNEDGEVNGNGDKSEEALAMALNATIECRVTRDLQIQGLVGHATALPVRADRSASVLSTVVGEGNAVAWKVCCADPQSTYAIYLDKADSPNAGAAYVQFTFHYEHPAGGMRVRVTTVPLGVVADSDAVSLEAGFDQDTAAVAIARAAVDKLQPHASKSTSSPEDVMKNLDKQLVEFCRRFAVYLRGDLTSFRLSSTYAMLPQFVYHLRRSPFLRVFNSSPDESAYVRHLLMHEDVSNALIMIQPLLLLYDIDTFGAEDNYGNVNSDPVPVLLDSVSLGATKILLLDTFFHILIFHGSTVAQWRKLGYHKMEGYEHFKEFLEAPRREAMEILLERFPLPRFIDCDEGGSQARFLMAKLNPSTSYSTNPSNMYGGLHDVLTDDTSLQMFMDLIQRAVVGKK